MRIFSSELSVHSYDLWRLGLNTNCYRNNYCLILLIN
jgi:hypothetical protein